MQRARRVMRSHALLSGRLLPSRAARAPRRRRGAGYQPGPDRQTSSLIENSIEAGILLASAGPAFRARGGGLTSPSGRTWAQTSLAAGKPRQGGAPRCARVRVESRCTPPRHAEQEEAGLGAGAGPRRRSAAAIQIVPPKDPIRSRIHQGAAAGSRRMQPPCARCSSSPLGWGGIAAAAVARARRLRTPQRLRRTASVAPRWRAPARSWVPLRRVRPGGCERIEVRQSHCFAVAPCLHPRWHLPFMASAE